MKHRSEDISKSSIDQVVSMTTGTDKFSLGMALNLVGISLEMLVRDEDSFFRLLMELDFEDSRRLQWWLDDFKNTGISIL